MSDPIFEPPDADDTIRETLPPTARPPVSRGAAFSSDTFDAPFTSEFTAAPSSSRAKPTDDAFDDFFVGEDGTPDEFAHDAYLKSDKEAALEKAFDLASVNLLVGAAAPLLWLAGRLNESSPPEDVERFRQRVLAEIKQFETAAMARDIPSRLVRMTRYAIAATLDDIILNTAWGGQAAWAGRSLVSVLYNETWGGERFYEILSQMRRQPDENIDGLEFMAICLAVGFAGKYRVMEGGQGRLSRLRHELYRIIRRVRGPYDRELSPPWEPIAGPHAVPKSARSAWIIAALALLAVAALWVFSSFDLRTRVAAATKQIDALTSAIPATVSKPSIPNIPEPEKPKVLTRMERLQGFLADDIKAGRVELAGEGSKIAIRMLNASFPSGGVDLADASKPLVARIAAALNPEKGPIEVVGNTDNVLVPAGSKLGDNMAISKARADSAANVLRQHLDDPSRVTSIGRGSTDPIASNATAEGRMKNRRVEFLIDAEAPH
ncbi:MAG TPA: type IVB secretion system protein IcmH/DotU [Rhizobiaceae bacterium]|jgi:type VI secretion system protein ImpK|nr:type IVB secretion system protein IcmH/DotU [Rhizobiaceae bacterium]